MSSKSFIVIIIFYFHLASPFFLCMYGTAYFIMMLLFLQNFLTLVKMNSLPQLVWRAFIHILLLFSTFGSQVWKISINLSFKYK